MKVGNLSFFKDMTRMYLLGNLLNKKSSNSSTVAAA